MTLTGSVFGRKTSKRNGRSIYYVLTNAHLTDDIENELCYVAVGRQWIRATIYGRNRKVDLLTLGFYYDGKLPAVRIATSPGKKGDRVTIQSMFRNREAEIKHDTGFFTGTSRMGESGSPIIRNNELVGVLKGTELGPEATSSLMVQLGEIRDFITNHHKSVPTAKTGIRVPPAPPITGMQTYIDPDLNRDNDRRLAITELRRRIIALESKQGTRGPTGKQGPKGDKGGDQNLSEILSQIEDLNTRLTALGNKPLTVQWVNAKTGKVTATTQKRLGETLRITFSPK